MHFYKYLRITLCNFLYRLLPGILVQEQALFKGSPEHINAVANLIKRSKKYFFSIGGECNSILWQQTLIIEALKEVSEEVKICIACGPEFDIKSIDLARLINLGKITFFRLSHREELHHFQVNDSYDVAYHTGNEKDICTKFYGNSPYIMNKFVKQFLYKINKLTPLQPGTFFEIFNDSEFITFTCEYEPNNKYVTKCVKIKPNKKEITEAKEYIIDKRAA